MMCTYPFGNARYGCGRCLPCKSNRRRVWTTRLLLESLISPISMFITLTYSDENLPDGHTLVLSHGQNLIKRLRMRIHPRTVRYFIVGEYGDRTSRPHYHILLFGDFTIEEVEKSWTLGDIYPNSKHLERDPTLGSVTPQSIAYVVSYVMKQTNPLEIAELKGRFPPFARMSLRPAIGVGAVKAILAAYVPQKALLSDVPSVIRLAGKKMPLGHFLRKKLRILLGGDGKATQASREEMILKVLTENKHYGKKGLVQVRLQHQKIAERRLEIQRSKKGIGI